jgi:hypothetical protein
MQEFCAALPVRQWKRWRHALCIRRVGIRSIFGVVGVAAHGWDGGLTLADAQQDSNVVDRGQDKDHGASQHAQDEHSLKDANCNDQHGEFDRSLHRVHHEVHKEGIKTANIVR